MDVEGHLTQQTAGNGLVTTRSFSATTGRLNAIATGAGGAVQNLAYSYDLLGNPLLRSDANTSLSESFAYDGLNRLTSATVNLSPTPLVKAFAYSPIGNILLKSDVGNYSYPAAGSPQPHAVMSVSGGAISTSFTYDANGNQTSGLGRSIVYTSYNKPASITQGARTISFLDDSEHQRFKQITPEGATLYIAAFGVLAEVQNPGTMSQKWTDYLSVGNAKVGMRVLQSASETLNTRYFHTDHLGSISVITDENGLVVERLSYDAWGKRRFANGADDPTGSITSQSTRGFTGEEELSVSGLVHLNGRVYDPLLARFTSADTITENPFSTQGWNRYSYVGNDPLAFTDPSGHCFLGCFWQHVAHFIATNPIVRAVVQIAATVILNAVLPGLGFAGVALAAASAAGGAAIATGLSGGNLGQILRSAAIAGATAAAFFEVGSLTYGPTHASPGFDSPNFNAANYAENVAGHALVGCASSVASGGSCQSGALSAGITAGAGPLMSGQSFEVKLVENAVLGGAASVAGGGKFANGAITGAFGYMFNACGGPHGCLWWGSAIGTGAGIIAAAGCDYGTAGACIAANGGIVGVFGSGMGALGAALDIIGNAWTQSIYNSMKIGPYADPVIVGDSRGNNIPLAPGETLVGSDDGRYVQVRGANGQPTGVRGDFGGHSGQADPVAQGPHGHVPGITQPDGNPHLPVRE
jgi:RHS repeat-associated protein